MAIVIWSLAIIVTIANAYQSIKWPNNYPAIIITDTAPFRNPYYHTAYDTSDKLNYGYMALLVDGLAKTFEVLAN